jgi:membrane dipeptidase
LSGTKIISSLITLGFIALLTSGCDRPTHQIHVDSFVADTHNDVLLRAMEGEEILLRHPDSQSDLVKLKMGGVDLQVFSVWVSPLEFVPSEYFQRADDMISKLEFLCSRVPDQWRIIDTYQDINYNQKRDIMSCVIGVEGGHVIGNDITKVEHFFDRGMKYLGLTWNNSNSIGTSAKDEFENRVSLKRIGLTKFGRKVVKECNRLGVMIDISHAGEKTFWDVINLTSEPIIASHSSVYTLCPHYRNLKDDQLVAIGKNGGVVFVNFYPGYIDSTYLEKEAMINMKYEFERQALSEQYDASSISYWHAESKILKHEKSRIVPDINTVVRHIRYISDLVGVDHVGLGSDYDGVDIMPAGLEDVTKLPFLTKKLLDSGFSLRDVRKILGGNFKRVFREVCS